MWHTANLGEIHAECCHFESRLQGAQRKEEQDVEDSNRCSCDIVLRPRAY